MFWTVLITIGVIYLAILLLVYLAQSSLVYFPSRTIHVTPQAAGLAYEDVEFDTEDGVRLHGWFVPADSTRATLLFCHGNAGNISNRLESIAQFNGLGLNVFIFDYRGYGRSEGKPNEAGTYRDAEAAWTYLTGTRGLDSERIVIFGRSLGGSVAAWLATQFRPQALIVESAFTSLPDIGARHYPFLPVRLMSRFDYDTREYVSRVNAPVMIIHSADDELVPFEHGRKIFEAAAEPKRFLDLAGSHNDGYLASAARYEAEVTAFLDSCHND